MLRKPYKITVKLQYSELTPGYFFRKWTGLKAIIQNNGSLLALDMLDSMNKREFNLLNDLVLAAVFIDVLNADLLSEDQSRRGREALTNLPLKMKGLRDDESRRDPDDEVIEEDHIADSDSDEEMLRIRSKSRPPHPLSDKL